MLAMRPSPPLLHPSYSCKVAGSPRECAPLFRRGLVAAPDVSCGSLPPQGSGLVAGLTSGHCESVGPWVLARDSARGDERQEPPPAAAVVSSTNCLEDHELVEGLNYSTLLI